MSYGELAEGMAEIRNERTLRHARRFVYAPFRSEELLKKATDLRGTGPKIHTKRLQIGEKLVIWTEFRE